MFRLCNMAKDSVPCESVFDRLYDLPVVKDSVTRLSAVYSETKAYNSLLRRTLETAESGMGIVLFTAKPVMKAFEKPLGVLNSLACAQLEKFEKDYPIITQPSEEVLKQTKSTYISTVQPIADRLMPLTDRFNCVAKLGYDKAVMLKDYSEGQVRLLVTYTVQKYGGVKTYASTNMAAICDVTSQKISVVLGEERTRHVIARVDLFLSNVEECVDKYLPPVDGESTTDKQVCVDERAGKHCMTEHVWNILNKVTLRSYWYTRRDLLAAYQTSLETITKLSPSEVSAWVCVKACVLRNRIFYLYHEVTGSTDALGHQESEKILSVYELRLITAIRRSRRLMFIVRESLQSFIEKIYIPLAQPQEAFQKIFISPRTYVAQPVIDELTKYMNMKQLRDLQQYIRHYYDTMTSSMTSLLPTRFLSSELEPQPATVPQASEENSQKEEDEKEEKGEEKEDSFHSAEKTSGPNSGHSSDHDHQDE